MTWAGTISRLPLASLHDGLPGCAADGEDGGLGRVDDGGEFLDAEHAEVGDGEGGAGHLLGLEFAGAAEVGEDLISWEIWRTALVWAWRMTGTTRPSSRATAMPRSTVPC